MPISPGIYALHRAAAPPPAPALLEDEATGLRLATGPAAGSGAAVTIVLSGTLRHPHLGSFGPGEALVGDGTAALQGDAVCLGISCAPAAAPPAPLALRRRAHPVLPPCDPTPADLLISGRPEQTDLTLFRDATGRFGAGFWTSTAYHRRSIAFPKFEVMHLTGGWIELAEETGATHRFDAGDTFLIAKGTRCDWKTGGMEKLFCSYVPN
ncbi:cupin domain-containing protein [Mangrovicoccus algicola]|uniref:DUF861 domain-containing protein n=1 Tax=Mangrovicoccus algicola TaxID=2771008 RepID=A0A8J7CJG5_9RHOB|nr:cupin domain-containing protein [Mangrovicoccus algicola]MBE3637636.1 DUF861 domain-containing protein [Mangrovicoccus algicola]